MKKAVSWMGIAAAAVLVAGCAHNDQNNASMAGDDTPRTASGQPVIHEMPGSQGPVGDYSRTSENSASINDEGSDTMASGSESASGSSEAMSSDASGIPTEETAMGATTASDTGEGSATGSTTAAGGATGTAASEPAMSDANETNDVATTTTTKDHKAHAKKKKAAKHKAEKTEETTMNMDSSSPSMQTATAPSDTSSGAEGAAAAGGLAATSAAGGATASAEEKAATTPATVQPMATQKLMREVALNQIHHINQKQMALAEIAEDESESSAIKQAAEKMEADHERLEDRIEEVAEKQDVDLKGFQPSTFEEAAIDGLDDLEGRDFDLAFVQTLRDDNRVATEQLEMLRTRISDPEIVALIDEALPTVRMHEQSANALSEINPSQDYSADSK